MVCCYHQRSGSAVCPPAYVDAASALILPFKTSPLATRRGPAVPAQTATPEVVSRQAFWWSPSDAPPYLCARGLTLFALLLLSPLSLLILSGPT